MAIALVPLGALADRLGRKKIFGMGLCAFNHPDNSRATIFGAQVNHCFDATKLLIDPRHQLIHRR